MTERKEINLPGSTTSTGIVDDLWITRNPGHITLPLGVAFKNETYLSAPSGIFGIRSERFEAIASCTSDRTSFRIYNIQIIKI